MSVYSPTPFPDKYRSLGELPSQSSDGGDGSSFQRWEDVHSKEAFLVMKMPMKSSVMDDEVAVLSVLKQCQVSGVIQVMEVLTAANGDCYAVYELLEGITLFHCINICQRPRFPPDPAGAYRKSMFDIGAQLVQAVGFAHNAGVVHLNLTSDNIQLGHATDGLLVKMTGFGFSKRIATVAGPRVEPAQTSPFYAAPEVLDSLLCDPSGTSSRLVDGAAADVWSTGIILLEALIGRVYFDQRLCFSGPNAFCFPDFVYEEHSNTWKKNAEVRQLQKPWFDRVAAFKRTGSMLANQLIFHIKYCSAGSSDPSAAADFFLQMLHPDPAARMTMAQAARHPYMAPAMQKLQLREARLGATDHPCSTYASSPLAPATEGPFSTSRPVCTPPSNCQLSSVSSSTTGRASLSFKSTAHSLYLIWQHSRLPYGLSLISRALSTILRYISASKARQTSAATSKPAGHIDANCNLHSALTPGQQMHSRTRQHAWLSAHQMNRQAAAAVAAAAAQHPAAPLQAMTLKPPPPSLQKSSQSVALLTSGRS